MNILLDNSVPFLIMAGLLCLSAFFSGSETALFSLKIVDLNQMRRRGDTASRAVLTLHEDRADFLMTVLFCNMGVNILFFAFSATIAAELLDERGHGVSFAFSLITLLVVITLGEVTPKSVATISRTFFARIVALPMLLLHRLLTPVRIGLGSLVRLLERMLGVRVGRTTVHAQELKMLMELSRKEGLLSAREHEFIREILDLPEVRVREMMTPRVDVVAVDAGADAAYVLARAREQGHSKLPVRDPTKDELVAWIDAREIFVNEATGPITPFVRDPLFVSELDRADQVLTTMRERRVPLAIVVDERGATAGILTLTDLLAEIFGEIGDEDAPVDEPIVEEAENVYRLAGNLSVREWRDLFGVAHPLPRTATMGGLVTALLGRPPHEGDTVALGNLRMEVLRVRKRRVVSLRLVLIDKNGNGGKEAGL